VTRIPTDPEQIRQLAAIMADSGLTEIELADKDTRIRVVRGVVSSAQSVPSPALTVPGRAELATHPSVTQSAEGNEKLPGAVTSPMVGVAFLAPEPGAPNFVSIGQQVISGQTLLLIEAMKTFNQIKAPRAGVVTKMIAQNGTPVEYGELLMVVE
jgi:acetyl-CoA carboxylase biotin carboxyl carrier protein